jgi:transposase InsO family protein
MIVHWVDEAITAGASLPRACAAIGLSKKTLGRWRVRREDGRRGPVRSSERQLSPEERKRVVEVATSTEFRDLSPRQIVPLLADRNEYLASESTFYRVLRSEGLLTHRRTSRPCKPRHRPQHVASAPNQLWSWDITYLRSAVRGRFFFLYLIVDVWSRKIVGWSVHEDELAEHSSTMIENAMHAEGVARGSLTLHADNGGPMKASTMLVTLQRLGIVPSFSRPCVSDDNPFSEALFRTLKYTPAYPKKPFACLEAARDWVAQFVAWYNDKHLHSALRFVTPSDRHALRDKPLLAARAALYANARSRSPQRWTRDTRSWTPVKNVALNPDKTLVTTLPIAIPV